MSRSWWMQSSLSNESLSTLGFGLFAGATVGWLVAARPEMWHGLRITLEVLTALGTVGAVCVALWQTRKAHEREDDRVENARILKRDDDQRRASLASAGLALRLESIGYDVDLVAGTMDVLPSDILSVDNFMALLMQFKAVDLTVPLETLLAIAPLPDDCPDNVAAGLASLDFTRATMTRWSDGLFHSGISAAHREKLLRRWCDEIYEAEAVLSIARKSLTAASRSVLVSVRVEAEALAL